ncbi:hypothetical protein OIV83_005312 [Microbotryomycetes sp. JL201]|nr:hypothetical protein OIV83_005312 [Microbotryomycetes sp. JL201]
MPISAGMVRRMQQPEAIRALTLPLPGSPSIIHWSAVWGRVAKFLAFMQAEPSFLHFEGHPGRHLNDAAAFVDAEVRYLEQLRAEGHVTIGSNPTLAENLHNDYLKTLQECSNAQGNPIAAM